MNNLKSKVATIERRLGKLGVDVAQPATTDQPEAAAPALSLHENDEVGQVAVHFPRLGYDWRPMS